MNLTTSDRLIILTVLPKSGNIETMKIVSGIRKDVMFSDDERKIMNLREKVVDGQTRMLFEPIPDKKVDLSGNAKALIRSQLENMNDASQLSEDHIPIYEKFVT